MVRCSGGESGLLSEGDSRACGRRCNGEKILFPKRFVLDYKEEFGDVEGTGTFTLVLRQKKDKIASVAVEGNYSA